MRLMICATGVAAVAASASAQQFFQASDGVTSFSKAAFADWTDPANQDQITPTVAITRQDIEGIFNIVEESSYSFFSSPTGTQWVFGATVQDVIDGTIGIGDFASWEDAHGSFPPGTVGVEAVLYLEDDDAYVDIMFTNWGSGGSGGAFAYDRASIPAPGALALLGLGGLVAARRRR
ncbi:MAG: hypothetical protein ACFCBV_14235 [Phycisphaerales bacterium]